MSQPHPVPDLVLAYFPVCDLLVKGEDRRLET